MKPVGWFMSAFLLLSILSYGMPVTVMAQTPGDCEEDEVFQNGQCVPAFDEEETISDFTLDTDSDLYSQGNIVMISGSVNEVQEGTDVGYKITDPSGNIVAVGQLKPSSDGTFSTEVLTEGPYWKPAGNYKITAKYGGLQAIAVFEYAGGTGDVPPPPVECGPDERMVDGECVPREPVECGPDEKLVDGECVAVPPPPPEECGPNEVLVDGECIPEEPAPTCEEGEVLVDGECIPEEPEIQCGEGTVLEDGKCVPETQPQQPGGGCLIATAAFGTELAPQVQYLREIRDSTVMSTASGSAFMTGFNQFYYSFSPTIADWERQNPIFQETVRAVITPMVSSLAIMELADSGSEVQVLGLGISVIMLNIGIYVAAPAIIGVKTYRHFRKSSAKKP